MRWYKWTVEQFEGLNNMGNGNLIVMQKGYGGRYFFSPKWTHTPTPTHTQVQAMVIFCLKICRYSLSMHHNEEELREFGLTDEMLIDQEW